MFYLERAATYLDSIRLEITNKLNNNHFKFDFNKKCISM